MKTYLFDTFNRYKRFSEKLDAKTILCNKSWWVFNDSGEKELYIFNTDGSLIISVSGKVTNATWKYVPANKSIIISGNNQSYMVHPALLQRQMNCHLFYHRFSCRQSYYILLKSLPIISSVFFSFS